MFFIDPPFGNYLKLDGCIPIKGSYTLEPRSGLIMQVFKTLRYSFSYGGWINKIGLRNPGLDYAIQKYKENLEVGGGEEVVSIAICDKIEIHKIISKIPEDMNIEINVSCPNHSIFRVSEKLDSDIGFDENGLERFLNKKRKWCIIKLSPIEKFDVIDFYYKIGFRQFHCSNTFPMCKCIANNVGGSEVGGRGVNAGGLSGSFLIPYTSKLITYLKKKEGVEIIAGGGVRNVDDAEGYKRLGADHISASTLFFNPF